VSELILKKVRIAQPQQAVGIDRSTLLGKTVTHCFNFAENRELVTGAKITKGVAASVGCSSKAGKSLKSDGSGACASVDIDLSGYNKISISGFYKPPSSPTTDARLIEYGVSTSGNSAMHGFTIDQDYWQAKPSIAVGVWDGNSTVYNYIPRPYAANEWLHFCFTIDRSSKVIKFYINGKEVLSTNATNNSLSGNFSKETLYFFSIAGSSYFGKGELSNVVLRGGYIMSAAETFAEFSNPWQIFAPERRVISFDSVVVGGGVNCYISASQIQAILAANSRSLASTGNSKQVQSEVTALSRLLNSNVQTNEVQTESLSLSRNVLSSVIEKQVESTVSVLNRTVISSISSKQTESDLVLLNRSLSSSVSIKQVESSLSIFSLTLDTVFSSQTKQAQQQQSAFNRGVNTLGSSKQTQSSVIVNERSLSSSLVTKQLQKSTLITSLAINSIVGISEVQKDNLALSTSLDVLVSIQQKQTQSGLSSYSLVITLNTVSKQSQSTVVATNRYLTSGVATSQVTKSRGMFGEVIAFFEPSSLRRYIVPFYNREYNIEFQNRRYLV
jgi:hypothetical protein